MTKNVPDKYAHLSGYVIHNEWSMDLLDDIANAVQEIKDHYATTWGDLPEIAPYGPQDRIHRAMCEILRRQGVRLSWEWVGLPDD